jgi:type VI secretion system protein ImpM
MSRFRPALTGLFGKLPARGDFVRSGLSEDFVAAWDGWCRDVLVAARAACGDRFEASWMEAPIWRFLLPPGACGGHAVLGVWLPSADKVGRHYPFGLFALADTLVDLKDGGAWLDMAEAAGLAAVVEDAPHLDVAARLEQTVSAAPLPGTGWWTQGGPFVAPNRLDHAGLLPPGRAVAMLRDPIPEAG